MIASPHRFTGYGRPVLTSRTDGPMPRLRWFVIPGTKRRILLRDGAVGFNLVHFAVWWDRHMHRLDKPGETPDEWGYADRAVRDSTTTVSEHAGGAAEDLDATLHPRGVPILRTFTKYQVFRIRRRLRLYRAPNGEAVLGWGGNYTRTVDGMHVEWANGTTLAQAERVARRLMDSPVGVEILKANPGLRKVILS